MKKTWAKALEEHLQSNGSDTIPDGWKTMLQISEELGKSESYAYTMVRSLLKHDKAIARQFSVRKPSGIKIIPHYKLK